MDEDTSWTSTSLEQLASDNPYQWNITFVQINNIFQQKRFPHAMFTQLYFTSDHDI